jgi:hypothetical protein
MGNGHEILGKKLDLSDFTLNDMTICGKMLRQLGEGAQSMEEAATRITNYLYLNLVDKQTQKNACALVRLFKTHSYKALPSELQRLVKEKINTVTAQMKSFVLLGTKGDRNEWNSRKLSSGHKAIPLPSEEVANKIPMMRNMIKHLGLEVNTVINPDPKIIIDLAQKTFNVFYVPEALDSPYIPAQQDFVIPCGIKSVLGFGGVLPDGDVYVVIMFSKVHILPEVTEFFKPLALNVKLVLLPYLDRVFE